MAAHARLKNEFMEDEKYHNLILFLICVVVIGDDNTDNDITETSPYSFGNFRKLSLYNCFMPI